MKNEIVQGYCNYTALMEYYTLFKNLDIAEVCSDTVFMLVGDSELMN